MEERLSEVCGDRLRDCDVISWLCLCARSDVLRDEREKPVPKRFSVSVGLRPLVRIGITQQPRESAVREEDHLAAVLFDVNDQVVGEGDGIAQSGVGEECLIVETVEGLCPEMDELMGVSGVDGDLDLHDRTLGTVLRANRARR